MKRMKKLITGLLCIIILADIPLQPVKAEEQNQSFTPSGLTKAEFENYCDTYFEEQVKNEIPGASIAVVSNGQIVFEKGYGYSDIENEKASDPQSSVYEYGSVSKLFTWVSLMQLYEKDKVDLSTDIRQYLPADFVVPTTYERPITILDLMNHQAGFDDYIIHLFNQENNMVSLREALEENKVQQIYEPGFASSYSNYGAGLAGYIVENVAGMPEYEYVEKNVLKPSGMQYATLNPDISSREDILQNKAKVYEKTKGGFQQESWTYISMYPAGAANGTVEELAYFAMSLLDEENHPLFENSKTQKEMLSTSYQGNEEVAGIAHGFIEYDGEKEVYWHNGGTDHSSTFFAVVPELDFGIAICTNSGNISSIQKFGFGILAKKEVLMQTPQENLPPASVVEGVYQDFREDHRGITKIISLSRYLFPNKIKAINENQITIDGSIYNQVEPYVYQDIDTGDKLSFEVQNGKVVKYSYMLDYLKIPQNKIVFAWVQAIIIGLFCISLAVSLVYICILLVKKKFQKMNLFLLVSVAGWGILLVNLVGIVCRISSWETFDAIRPWLYFGRGLGIFITICDIMGIVKGIYRKEKADGDWVQIMILTISLLAVTVLVTLGGFSVNY